MNCRWSCWANVLADAATCAHLFIHHETKTGCEPDGTVAQGAFLDALIAPGTVLHEATLVSDHRGAHLEVLVGQRSLCTGIDAGKRRAVAAGLLAWDDSWRALQAAGCVIE